MLSATCDEFLKNLCDCMELAEGSFGKCLLTSSCCKQKTCFEGFKMTLGHLN